MPKKEVMWPMGRPSNDASYVTETDFRDFVAWGMGECWLSHDPDDCNADASMARPITTSDVKELRGYFLDALETIIAALWEKDYEPGEGWIDGSFNSLIIGPELAEDEESNGNDDTFIQWGVRLDKDAMMMELSVSGSDGTAIWLSYDALTDRKSVLNVLKEANKITGGKVYDKLKKLALQPNTPLYVEVEAE